ncbi:DNA-3-methyladenine glycosylase [Lacticaseibacillus saniviri]
MQSNWFLSDTTENLARALLGKVLTVDDIGGYIVETEAYLGQVDEAAHVFGDKLTPRTRALYADPGTIYVYQMRQYSLLNVSTQAKGTPQGILIRAIEPAFGIATMQERRQQPVTNLTNGPGKLAQALAITVADTGGMINQDRIQIHETGAKKVAKIMTSPRIGVPNKGEWTEAPLRYYVAGNPDVSAIKKQTITTTRGWLT